MGTISRQYTFVAGAVPTSTNWNADWSNIITLANGQIDKANVDSASTDGIVTMDETQTISGVKTWTGAQTTKAAVTVGVDDTGHDVKFFGATSGAYCLWDESADDLKLVGAAGLTVAGTSALTVLTASTITGSGVLSIDDTTESTSTTTGSIHTDGGLGVVGDIYAGDDIFLTAAGVLNWGGGDVTVTGGTNLLTFAGGVINLGTNAGAGIAHTDGTFHVHTATAGTVAAGGGAEDLVIEGGNATGMTLLSPDANSTQIYFGSPTDNNGGQVTYFYNSGAPYMAFATGSTERMRIGSGGVVHIGDTANGSMTVGLTINQGTNDTEILALKSEGEVAHGVSWTETDTYGFFSKAVNATGGLNISGVRNSGTTAVGMQLQAIGGAVDTAKSTSAAGAFMLLASYNNSGTPTDHTSNGNMLVIQTGAGGTSRYIFDVEGSAHADVEWTTFSDARLKHNIVDLPYGLKEVLALEPKLFDKDSGYIDDDGQVVLEGKDRRMVGFLAQDVKALMPEMVRDVDESTSFYSLDYGRFTPALVNAIKELEARVQTLEKVA